MTALLDRLHGLPDPGWTTTPVTAGSRLFRQGDPIGTTHVLPSGAVRLLQDAVAISRLYTWARARPSSCRATTTRPLCSWRPVRSRSCGRVPPNMPRRSAGCCPARCSGSAASWPASAALPRRLRIGACRAERDHAPFPPQRSQLGAWMEAVAFPPVPFVVVVVTRGGWLVDGRRACLGGARVPGLDLRQRTPLGEPV